MAKPLVFQFGEQTISYTLNKVDRQRLYGYKEAEVVDERNRPCELATLAEDGRTVVGRGGTGIGYISADGQWCDKARLKPVDVEGKEIVPVGSSFSAPITLGERASTDQYLNHHIRLVYELTTEDDQDALYRELKQGTIFTFPYSYRGGLEADAAFLLLNAQDRVFMAVGRPSKLEFLGLQQAALFSDEEEEADETDLMDFDMI